MAHLWVKQENDWAVLKLESPVYDLLKNPPEPGLSPGADRVELMLVDREWVLLAEPETRAQVNGLPVAANIHVLVDRDEIMVNQDRLYFSTEVLAVVEKYSGTALRCPRCKLEIKAGDPVVRCPGCKSVHHEDCWSYAPTCSLCPAPTPRDAGYQWTPEEL